MTNQLDDLFKEKLSGHSITPSDNTWSRVNNNLSKKNKGVIAFRLAAAILLLAALVTGISRFSDRSANTESVLVKQTEAKDIRPIPENKSASVDQGKVPQKSVLRTKRIHLATHKSSPLENPAPDVSAQNEPQTKDAVTEPEQFTAVVSPAEKPIVLEYRLDAVPHHPSAEPQVAQGKSGLRRVIDLAWEAKNGDSPISLRQTKDELFALNFKSNKKINK